VDDQKRQKMMLVVLGILVLGAGSVFYFTRADSGASSSAAGSGPIERRERRTPEKAEAEETRRTTRTAKVEDRPTITRREGRTVERTISTRRERTGARRTKLRKEKLTPAG